HPPSLHDALPIYSPKGASEGTLNDKSFTVVAEPTYPSSISSLVSNTPFLFQSTQTLTVLLPPTYKVFTSTTSPGNVSILILPDRSSYPFTGLVGCEETLYKISSTEDSA